MKFEDYKKWQPTLAAYHVNKFSKEKRKEQAIIEMVGEAGEVLQVMTKAKRKGIEIPREKILDELGDTFWGMTGIMNEFDISFEEMIEYNFNKLIERYK